MVLVGDDDGDPRGAWKWFDLAYRRAEAAGDAGAMGKAALGLAGFWLHEQRTTPRHALLVWRLRQAMSALLSTCGFWPSGPSSAWATVSRLMAIDSAWRPSRSIDRGAAGTASVIANRRP